jgi:sigma-B regulation protein RsbU (phosphoserine phosphatase)
MSGQIPQERLENLLAVTEASLGRLGVDELLTELLNRVLEIVDADTAAVLLLDEGGDHLVARAACGLEEEVRQGVRVPFGEGFAGAIAATRLPVVLDHVGPTNVTNPILWEKGIRVMLGVPLLSAAKVIGVIHVGRLDDRPFQKADAELLGVVADRVAGAVQTHQLAVEQAAAALLERSLLPPTLPKRPGLELAARYVTREDRAVGGDWYDAFTLPSGMLWVVIGDVAGHGLVAAVVMGRVRSALRSYALEDHPPDEVLRLVDRKVLHFEVGAMVTLACAVSSPPYEQFQVVTAGHPPPIVAEPGRPARLLDIDPLPPLGIGSGFRRPPTTISLPLGGVLVLYTDGLVERRGEVLDVGLARLCAAVTTDHPASVCRTVMHEMVGSQSPEDDIAMVALRRNDLPRDQSPPGRT